MSTEKYDVQLYEKANGDCPIQDFLDSLDDKMAAKMYGMIELLEENGPALRKPYSEHLQDGIFELRAKFSSNITRVLYFFYVDKRIILTNGFLKKTQKTPKKNYSQL
ncbi:type II toxin-antitoxin system RelE/ParE family toxin [Anaerovibrio sp.]|uniref:type II toxin-antitoxin system RelE/ParE family toxin n=1 Tax=Anaerovibrio sp. TaxID=1872532 RepID=UPI0025BF4D37|nr:type II toxin-antitoxin system RelE/ParE family toxin [Anaerovibrio sp.]